MKLPQPIIQILNITQYSLLYLIIVGTIGYFIDRQFPVYDPDKHKLVLFLEICIQIVVSAIVIYYIRLYIRQIPFLFEKYGEHVNFDDYQYSGAVIISLIYLSVQRNLANKIYMLLKKEEKDIKKKIKEIKQEITEKQLNPYKIDPQKVKTGF